MDANFGNLDKPISLHRFLYADLNSVNKVDPSGEYTTSVRAGEIVHDFIGAEFVAGGEDRFADTAITIARQRMGLPGLSMVLGGLKRPDLIDFEQHELYEIKTKGEAAEGASKLLLYLTIFKSLDGRKSWKGGMSFKPTSVIPISSTELAIVVPPAAGLILYDVYDFELNMRTVQLAANAALLLTITTVSLTMLARPAYAPI